MKYIYMLSVLFIVLILQFSFVGTIFVAYATPNLLLALVLGWVLLYGFEKCWPLIVTAGMLYDLVSGAPVGTSMMSLTVGAYIFSFLSKRFLTEHHVSSIFVIILIVFTAGIMHHALGEAVLFLEKEERHAVILNLKEVITTIFYQSLSTLLAYGIIVVILKKVEKSISWYTSQIDVKRHA